MKEGKYPGKGSFALSRTAGVYVHLEGGKKKSVEGKK